MKLRSLVWLTVMVIATTTAFAQGKIQGKVIDKQSSQPVAYASVTLHKPSDSSLVNGIVTTDDGSFALGKIPYGTYLLKVTFMGYQTYYAPKPLTLSASTPVANLGKIVIAPTATTLKAAEITAERSMVEYQLDKRVVNVDKNIVAGGGTATDVLENVPSVAMDNDGNVTLRGSTNVKVLIDGRPYELMGSDLSTLLEQIPASTVESVEVITNPSAKYDPEGMSGIINVKLKDRSEGALGLNGVVNLNIGAPLPFNIPDNMPKFIPNATASINLNYSTKKFNFTFSLDGGTNSRANTSTTYLERRRLGAAYSIDSLYESSIGSNYMGSMKVGAEYFINDKNSVLFSYQVRGSNRTRNSIVDDRDLFSTNGYLNYLQSDTSRTSSLNNTINLSYTKKFDEKDRLLPFDATYNFRTRNTDGWQQQMYNGDALWNNYYLRLSEMEGANNNVNIRLNYTHPFGEKYRFETGYEGSIMSADQACIYTGATYNAAHVLDTAFDAVSSTHYIHTQQIHAIYGTFAAQITEKLTAQAGLRGEYSNLSGTDKNHPERTPIDKDYWEIYPTLHLSYQINEQQSFQLSYSRRVQRPMMWALHPYIEVEEGQQLSFGNPSLDPEFTNAYEFSYNFGFKQTNIFTSLYFRQTNNMMTRYGFVWDVNTVAYYVPWMVYNAQYDGYWASTWQNLNKGVNCGLELIVDQQIAKWWKVNVSINLYDSYIEGTALLNGEDKNAFRVSGKFSSYMNLPKDWTIQFSGQYRAPFMDLQTDMLASYWADLAVKKDILQHRGSINLRVGDVFCTGGFGHNTDNEQLYRVFRGKRISPTVTLGFSYKINNGLKQQKPAKTMDEDSNESEY